MKTLQTRSKNHEHSTDYTGTNEYGSSSPVATGLAKNPAYAGRLETRNRRGKSSTAPLSALPLIEQAIDANRAEAARLIFSKVQEDAERLNLLNETLFDLETARADIENRKLAPYRTKFSR